MSSIEYYTNSIADGKLSWHSVSSCTSDSGDAMENWKNRLHEVSLRRCVRIKISIRRVGIDAIYFPTYERLPNLMSFIV